MPLVLGLGNPGARYARTRHNTAWRVLDRLIERWSARPGERAGTYRCWHAAAEGHEVDLVIPLSYMNASGEALLAWRERHALAAEELLVVADDVYLPLGCLRLRAYGSSGGHRGLESVEAALGGRHFARLRIGVGAAGSSAELREHVLEEFDPGEWAVAEEAEARAADAVACWVAEGLRGAMNRFNRRVRKEVSEP